MVEKAHLPSVSRVLNCFQNNQNWQNRTLKRRQLNKVGTLGVLKELLWSICLRTDEDRLMRKHFKKGKKNSEWLKILSLKQSWGKFLLLFARLENLMTLHTVTKKLCNSNEKQVNLDKALLWSDLTEFTSKT